MKKIIRISTVPGSLKTLLKGQLSFMKEHYEIIAVSSEGEELKDVEETEGVRTKVIEMTRSITPLKDVIAVFKLYKFLKKEKPFIVHTHTPKAGTLGMLAARLAGVPNRLHTIAGLPLLESNGLKRVLLNFVEKLTYANSTLILPNSFGLLEIIKQHKFTSQKKLKVIANGSSNGIDTNYFDKSKLSKEQINTLSEHLNIKRDDFVFIFVGRLVADKGINELVLAFNQVSELYENAKLLLVGSFETKLDPLSETVINCIENNSKIKFIEWQQDVRPYFALADVLTFPSYREGFPNVVLQASALELPCIVTNINGCNEIITHELNGLIVESKQILELKRAMIRLLEDETLRMKLKSYSRENILLKYKREVVWNELLKVYNSLKKNNSYV